MTISVPNSFAKFDLAYGKSRSSRVVKNHPWTLTNRSVKCGWSEGSGMPQRGGLLLVVATAVVTATLLVAVPLRRNPVASELAQVDLTAANGEPLEPAGPAFGKKQQALLQMAAAPRRAAPRSVSRLAAVPAAVRPVRKGKKVISGKAIFARMVGVLGKVAKEQKSKVAKPAPKRPADLPMSPKFATKAFKQALALQSLAAEKVNEDGEIDVNGTNAQKYSTYHDLK